MKNILLLLITLIIGLGICEAVARLITTVNEDGQAFYRTRPLLPYRFPAEMVRRKMEHYFSRQSEAYVIDDPLLGWTIGPGRTNLEGMYRANSAGIRSRPNEYPLAPPEGVLRIALFGDSFTHGDEVPFSSTWGKFLEDYLNQAGVAAEVLNFGVPGYGIGQAYLRWKHVGQKYSPRFAVFGFQPENIKRTVNIFRSLYSRDTWLVFSKPRFFIGEQGELGLLNSPVIPPKEVPEVLKDLTRSPLAEYEYWYLPENYRPNFRLKSRFLSLLYTIFSDYRPKPGGRHDFRPGEHYWDRGGEPMRTSHLILREFSAAARDAGQTPIILHIPKRNDLKALEQNNTPIHYHILEDLAEAGVMVVDPAEKMVGKSRLYKKSHYSSQGGRIVARVLTDAILDRLEREGLREAFRGEVPSRNLPPPGEILIEEYDGSDDLLIDLGTAEDRLFVGPGFHHREKHLGRTPVRWTGQTAIVRLPFFAEADSSPLVSFRVVETGPERGEVGMALLELEGTILGEVALQPGENIYRLKPERPADGEGIANLIISSPPWQPRRELGVADSRELGVMLDWVKLEY